MIRRICRLLAASLFWIAVQVGAQPNAAYHVAWVSLDQAASNSPLFAAFRAGMADLGYVDGKNLKIDAWWGEGSIERLEMLTSEILLSRPDVIVAQGGVALGALLHSGVTKPVVFGMSADPVDAKIASSYARPGGNVTGITLFAAELVGKRLELIKEVVPGARRIAIIANPNHPGEQRELQSAREAAAKLGLTLRHFPVQTVSELDAALAEIAKSRMEAALVFSDGFALGAADRIAEFSLRNRIAVFAGWAPFAQRGNLLAYGPEFADVYRRLATYVDRIRKGARPGELPVEQPTKFELVINLKTAKALDIKIPQSLLLRADEVIQ